MAEELYYELIEWDLEEDNEDIFFMAEQEQEAAEAGYHSKIILPSKYEAVDTDEVARQSVFCRVGAKNSIFEAAETGISSDPQGTVAIFEEGNDQAFSQAVRARICGDDAVF